MTASILYYVFIFSFPLLSLGIHKGRDGQCNRMYPFLSVMLLLPLFFWRFPCLCRIHDINIKSTPWIHWIQTQKTTSFSLTICFFNPSIILLQASPKFQKCKTLRKTCSSGVWKFCLDLYEDKFCQRTLSNHLN